ncbi:endonuclease [Corallincola holothuriorum]|uniref:Endonuclease n=1 Tax=Corallincola holothuriorum TaxID=2282215 RepID=A0A368NR11_9GAMM|nr:endonuclease/exonuclease/phosphatase family protein [Corallincola holothuriorum]RCU52540.1 endonuclease [Corallincola holothuriorum]
MRIATFNVENLDTPADETNPSLNQRVPILKAAFERINADIICLQEVHGQETSAHTSHNPSRVLSALDTVLAGTQYEHYHRAFTKTQNTPYDKRNLVILSKFEIEAEYQYRNDHIAKLSYRKVTANPPEMEAKDLSWERPILHAKLLLPDGSKLHMINLHLKSRLASKVAGQKNGFSWHSAAGWAEGYFLSSIKRVGQALETRILVDQIFDADPDAKIVVCGDFNAAPGEVPIEAMTGAVENTNNLNLRDRVLISCSRNIADSTKFSHLHHGQKNLLDHMLISQSLLTCFISAEIHNENLHDESLPFSYDSKYPESDHAPFIATFNL